MIDVEYLKRSKQEIEQFMVLMESFGEKTFKNILTHMQKSMLFMADSVSGRHVDLLTEYSFIKEKLYPFFGNEFFETYYSLNSLFSKEIKFLSGDRLIVAGKNDYNLDREYFVEMAKTIIKFFNTIYSRVENNGL